MSECYELYLVYSDYLTGFCVEKFHAKEGEFYIFNFPDGQKQIKFISKDNGINEILSDISGSIDIIAKVG